MQIHQRTPSARIAVLITLSLLLFLSPTGCASHPLCDALVSNDRDRIDELLERDLDPNFTCRWRTNRETPLILAARYNDGLVMRRLLELGAEVDAVDRSGNTALMYASGAAMRWMHVRRRPPSHGKVLTLIEYGADVNVQNWLGQTALMIAAETGQVESVKTLIKHGAIVDAPRNSGHTALHDSARAAQFETTIALLNAGAGVNVKSNNGVTPLMIASYAHSENSIRIMHVLLNAGADPNAHSDSGRSVLAIVREEAPRQYRSEVERILVAAGAQ